MMDDEFSTQKYAYIQAYFLKRIFIIPHSSFIIAVHTPRQLEGMNNSA